jgi:hypothetical protein
MLLLSSQTRTRLVTMFMTGLAVGAVACGSSKNNKGGYVSLGDAALQNYAQVLCNRFQTCTPDFIQSAFGDVNTCLSRVNAQVAGEFTGLGTTVYESDLDACTSQLSSADCDIEGHDLTAEAHAFIPECQFKGTVGNGGTCTSSAQCASGSCFKAQGQTTTNYCGVCSDRVALGGDCSGANCAGGLVCQNKKCVTPSGVGGACGADTPCAGILLCQGGKCQKPLGKDAECDPDNDTDILCDLAAGLRCLPLSPGGPIKGKCAGVTFAKLGEACGYDQASVKLTLCLGSSCTADTNGKCVDDLEEGQPCSDTQSIECAYPLACISGSCAREDKATCQ